jgi:hypothetical protein
MPYSDLILSDNAERSLWRFGYAISTILENEILEALSGDDPENEADRIFDDEGAEFFEISIEIGERCFAFRWSVDYSANVAYITSIEETEQRREFQIRFYVRRQSERIAIEDFFAETLQDSAEAFDKMAADTILLTQGLADFPLVKSLGHNHPGLTELRSYYEGIEYRIYFHQTRIGDQQVYVLFDGVKKNVGQGENQAIIDRCFLWLESIRHNITGLTVEASDAADGSAVRRLVDTIQENLTTTI